MQTHTHTNGPWFRTVSQDNGETVYEICTAADNGEPKEMIARVNHCVITPGLAISDEVRANAHLIAAAPDLILAMEEMLAIFGEHEQYDDESARVITQTRAAIAKSKGGA